MKRPIAILLIILTLPALAWSQPPSWQGKCVGVSDGDTITVMHDSKGEKIRLYGIDCPEKRQAFGKRAKQFTSDMVYGNTVDVKPVTTDRYGRTIGWVYVGWTCLNEELLRAGLAWHYKQYSSDIHLGELETEARHKKAGLWVDPNPITPWNFRRGIISVTTDKPKTTVQTTVYHGNIKSRKFHSPSCRYYDCRNCTVLVVDQMWNVVTCRIYAVN